MLQFKNASPFAGKILLLPDPDGIDSIYAIIKGTFSIGEAGAAIAIADEQVPIVLEPQYLGEPDRSSIQVPSDLSLMKPGTDVLLLGHAHAPGGRPVTQMDVSVSVGPVSKTVRVFGDRVWRTGATPAISRPAAFDTMPLIWERAFGGISPIEADGDAWAEPRNPVGVGFHEGREGGPVDESWLPNLEDPAELITSWKQQPSPACFSPLAPHWEPRRVYAGTYDEQWQQERAPYLPDDFDPLFFQMAPVDLISMDYLTGGELVEIDGASRDGLLRFRLPMIDLAVTYLIDATTETRTPVLDTILIEPDAERMQLVWRTVLPCDKRALQVKQVSAALVGR